MSVKKLIENPNFKLSVGMTYDELKAVNDEQAKIDGERLYMEGLERWAKAATDSDDVNTKNTFSNYVAKEDWQHKLIKECSEFANKALTGKGDLTLVLCGEYGSGKTHLASAILNHLRLAGSMVGMARQFNALIRDLWNNKADPKGAEKQRNLAENVKVLVLDEVGAGEKALGDGKVVDFGAIMRKRIKDKKITVITTNFTPKEFSAAVENYGFEALREGGCMMIDIPKGKNRNQRQSIYQVDC